MKKQLLSLSIALCLTLGLSAQRFFVNEDFNGGVMPSGWTQDTLSGSGGWKFGIDVSLNEEPGDQNLDSSNLAFFDDDFYGNNVNNTVALVSPTFDNALAGATTVSFDYNFRGFPGVGDSLYVEVWDGSKWVYAWGTSNDDDCGRFIPRTGVTTNTNCQNVGFPSATFRIDTINGQKVANANCQIRFVYHDGDDWSWYTGVDNVTITAPVSDDIMLAQIIDPISNSCGLNQNQTFTVQIKNVGRSFATNFDVSIDLDTAAQVLTETINDTIAPGDSLTYTFVGTLDMSTLKTYALKAYVDWSLDGGSVNDTAIVFVKKEFAFIPTYFDDFETFNNNWTVSGSREARVQGQRVVIDYNTGWERGFPSGTVISSASSGNNAYMTDLDSAYIDGIIESFLTTSCLDFSNSIGDPIVSFDLIYNTERGDDMVLEGSKDNGQTWERIEANIMSQNWYRTENTAQQLVWNGTSRGWERVDNVLTGYAGEGNVKLRFKFSTDNSNLRPKDGAGVDRFRIRDPFPVDLGIDRLIYPEEGVTSLCGFGNEEVTMMLENRGASILDTFMVVVDVTKNGITVSDTDTVYTSMAPNTRLRYTLNDLVDFSRPGIYDVDVKVIADNDGNPNNDAINDVTIINDAPPVRRTPFKEDFNASIPGTIQSNINSVLNGGWTKGPGNFQFQVANSGANLTNGTGPRRDHTGFNGNFIYSETTTGAAGEFASIESPCFDFTESDSIVLEFWYYGYGFTKGDLFVDVFDGVEWVDGVDHIRAASMPQLNRNSPWSFRSIDLDQFAGQRIKIRFRNEYNGPIGDIALDDIVIYQPIQDDGEVLNITSPTNGCFINDSSIVTIEVGNFGLDTIPTDSLEVWYLVVTQNPPDTVRVSERLPRSLIPRERAFYTFNQTADLSLASKEYEIVVGVDLTGDVNVGNDSLTGYMVENFTRNAGYIENFDNFSFVDGNCLHALSDLVARGWEASNGNYAWNVQNARTCFGPNGATATPMTGPNGDAGSGDGKFFYTEATLGAPGDVATLTSPCLDFGPNPAAAMAFRYHRFGSEVGNLYIDVLNDGVWDMGIDSIVGQTQFDQFENWKLKGVGLSQYAGKLVQVRFRAIKDPMSVLGTGDMAIDNIEFFEPIRQDARVSEILGPNTGCSPEGTVTVRVDNFGYEKIDSNTLSVSFSANNVTPITELIVDELDVDSSMIYTFVQKGNFSQLNTTFNLVAWTSLQNDSNIFNDSLNNVFRNITQGTDYQENFESFRDGACAPDPNFPPPYSFPPFTGDLIDRGWVTDPPAGNVYHWNVQNAAACGGTPTANTGPQSDHTRSRGNFMYAEAQLPGAVANFVSPCIDFTNDTTAGVSFWYHMYGGQTGSLNIDVEADGVWNLGLFTITGQQQTSSSDDWLQAFAKIVQFAGKEVRIRFRANKGGPVGDIAIDDVALYSPQPQDAKMNAVLGPVGGCEIFEQSVISVEAMNFGTKKIDTNTLMLFYQIDDNPPVGETYADSLKVDEVIQYTFTQTADLSDIGRTYNIKTWTSLPKENNVVNDTLHTYPITNNNKRTYYFEDFEDFRDAQCNAVLGQVLTEGWEVPSTNAYNWHVQSSLCRVGSTKGTPTALTGPDGDHTTGDGIFIYADAGNNNFNPTEFSEASVRGTASLVTPCIDLQPNTKVHLTYWYHRYGQNAHLGDQFIDVFSNGQWETGVDRLQGRTHTAHLDGWQQRKVDLSRFAGERVVIRFRAKDDNGLQGDIAIDDIAIFEPTPIDVGITQINSPTATGADGCMAGNLSVQVELTNFGTDTIDAGSIIMKYFYAGLVEVTDTVNVEMDTSETINFTFNELLDLSLYPGVNKLRVVAILNGDTIQQNNTEVTELNNRQPGLPRYFMDFERHGMGQYAGQAYAVDDMQGWKRQPTPPGPGTYGWHVQCGPGPYIDGQPPIPPAPPTGPSGDHTLGNTLQNGRGCYMLIESDIKPEVLSLPDALLELPCGPIDFSSSQNNKILLSFYYHMFGDRMGDLYVDVHDGIGWINRVDAIRGEQQFDDTERWKRRQIPLDRFAGNDSIRIRFRAEYMGRSGDIAIDDVEILDRAKTDARIDRIIDPTTDCDLRPTEQFVVRVQNTGTLDIVESRLCYQITYTPYKGDPELLPMVCDTFVGSDGFIAPLAVKDIEFNDRLDLSKPGEYKIKVWTKMVGDSYFFNDSTVEIVKNTTRPFPNCEDFSDMTLGDIPKNFRDELMPNAWSGNPGAYTFYSAIQNSVIPDRGHTGGSNDMYLLAFDPDGMPGQQARVESACYDLTNAPAAILEFWYKAPNPNHIMFVNARTTAGNWQPLDTLWGQGLFGVFNWKKETIPLNDFLGNFVQIQFISINMGGGFYAIDDFCINLPPPQQIQLERIISPGRGLCFYSNQEVVTLRIQNVGRDRIREFDIELAVDQTFQNFPAGQLLRDTVRVVINSAPFFDPGDEIDVALDLPQFIVDMSAFDTYYFNAWVHLDGDLNEDDNVVQDYVVNHPIPIELPYVENFEFISGETFGVNYTNGMRATQGPLGPAGQYLIREKSGLDIQGLTGPAFDHTTGTAEGVYMVTQAAGGQAGDAVALTTRCINLRNAKNPEIRYWYHMFGPDMGSLYLQANADDGWRNVDSILVETHTSNFAEWKSRNVPLPQYAGKVVRFRFVSFRGSGEGSDMGLDDINVFDRAAIDIQPISLLEPTNDTSSCYIKDQQVIVELRNNGSDSVNFITDSTFIEVVVFKDGKQIDSLTRWVVTNQYDDGTGNLVPLPGDSSVGILMDSTFDMSDSGSVYRFEVNVITKGDLSNFNDRYSSTVVHRRVGGSITDIDIKPNDTICSGDQVTLLLRNHFGEIRWEQKARDANGNEFWLPGLNFPFNERKYSDNPDTSTIYRARICDSKVISDSFEVIVIKPPLGFAIEASACEGQDKPELRVRFPKTVNAYTVADSASVDIRRLDKPWNQDGVIWPPSVRFNRNATPFAIKLRDTIPLNKDAIWPDGSKDTTKTVYVFSVIDTNVVIDGFCVSKQALPITGYVNNVPEPDITIQEILKRRINDTVIVNGVSTPIKVDTVCQDTTFLLNAGKVVHTDRTTANKGIEVFHRSTYDWTVSKLVNGNLVFEDTSSTQTMVVDAWQLDLNTLYAYSVVVTTDSGCADTSLTYWVRVVDSCVTSIAELQFKDGFNIYPNPVEDELFIQYESNDQFKGDIRLLTVEGQLIQVFNDLEFGNLNHRIDMGELPKGIYIIKVETDKGSFVEKIIRS